MKKYRKNDAGQLLGEAPVMLKDPKYGTGNYSGKLYPEVRWDDYRQSIADENGFDTRNREDNGEYTIEIELPFDTQLIRYGSDRGRFTAPVNTPYEELSLPYVQETIEFNSYRVIADSIVVHCRAQKGIVAPMFDSRGGGIQYLHECTIRELLKSGVLEEVEYEKEEN